MHLNGDFRTHDGAKGATGASAVIVENHGTIAAGVEEIGWNDIPFFAGDDAKVTFLAEIRVYIDFAFHCPRITPVEDKSQMVDLLTHLAHNVKIKNQIFVI